MQGRGSEIRKEGVARLEYLTAAPVPGAPPPLTLDDKRTGILHDSRKGRGKVYEMLTQEQNEQRNIIRLPAGGRAAFERSQPDPEVLEKPVRRRFSVAYKLNILKETDMLQPGEISALLRREGLYWATFARWRRERDAGQLAGLEPKKRGRKQCDVHPWANKVAQLEREKTQLQRKLDNAEKIIDVQKKISELFTLQQKQESLGDVQ